MRATRDGFGEGILEAARKDSRVIALVADLKSSLRLDDLHNYDQERVIQMGISEQHMASFAAGLAHTGRIPFACSFAAFNPGRNLDQIRTSICYSNENVKIVGSHAGVSVGEDGATHQALEDIAIMRTLPNMVVLVPSDANEARAATHAAVAHEGPVYLRLSREPSPDTTGHDDPFIIGRAKKMREGTDVAILACGQLVTEALVAADMLEKEGIHATVLNVHTIKPLDEEAILDAARNCGCVVTAEEHQKSGGLGGTVAELLGECYPVPIIRVGAHDTFGESGTGSELLTKYGLRAQEIVHAATTVYTKP